MVKRMQMTVADRQLLRPGQKVLVAVSGGQDSVCLIRLLSVLRSSWKWTLGIVHCDHQWSASSRLQASHVAQIATGLQIDYLQVSQSSPDSPQSLGGQRMTLARVVPSTVPAKLTALALCRLSQRNRCPERARLEFGDMV